MPTIPDQLPISDMVMMAFAIQLWEEYHGHEMTADQSVKAFRDMMDWVIERAKHQGSYEIDQIVDRIIGGKTA